MKSNRMFGILGMLLEKERITAKELAEYFEVSVRTIHRDLLDLSDAGFPVTSQQGIGGGISLVPGFKYNKTALDKEDINILLAGIQGFSSLDDSARIKTLLAKLRFAQSDKIQLENDVVIDFSSWNHNSTVIDKVRTIRSAIAGNNRIEMEYYGGSGHHRRCVEPYKLIFKQEHWYLFGYCRYKKDFRLFKVSRIINLQILEETFAERDDYTIPSMQSDFANDSGMEITVWMDSSLEFLAVDFFGAENIQKTDSGITAAFWSEHPDWVVSTFAGFGDKAEILSPDSMREEMRQFLTAAQNLYKI